MAVAALLVRHLSLDKQQYVKFSLGFSKSVRPLWEAEVEPVSA